VITEEVNIAGAAVFSLGNRCVAALPVDSTGDGINHLLFDFSHEWVAASAGQREKAPGAWAGSLYPLAKLRGSMNRIAGSALYGLLGSGALTAADMGLIAAGSTMDGDEMLSTDPSEKLQLIAAALGGLGLGGWYGYTHPSLPTVDVQRTPDGGAVITAKPPPAQAAAEAISGALERVGPEAVHQAVDDAGEAAMALRADRLRRARAARGLGA